MYVCVCVFVCLSVNSSYSYEPIELKLYRCITLALTYFGKQKFFFEKKLYDFFSNLQDFYGVGRRPLLPSAGTSLKTPPVGRVFGQQNQKAPVQRWIYSRNTLECSLIYQNVQYTNITVIHNSVVNGIVQKFQIKTASKIKIVKLS